MHGWERGCVVDVYASTTHCYVELWRCSCCLFNGSSACVKAVAVPLEDPAEAVSRVRVTAVAVPLAAPVKRQIAYRLTTGR